MNVSLTPELEQLIEQKVQSGMYHSASEVIRAGLRLLQEQEELRDIRLQELRNEAQKGLKSLKEGKGIPADEVFRELRERNANVRKLSK